MDNDTNNGDEKKFIHLHHKLSPPEKTNCRGQPGYLDMLINTVYGDFDDKRHMTRRVGFAILISTVIRGLTSDV
jgi:hypothetical protein